MIITRSGSQIKLTKEQGERRATSESDLFYRLRNLLIKRGYDVIKKLMTRDGHMVSEGIYYVRSRNINRQGAFMIWDANYQVRDSAQEFNDNGFVTLDIEAAQLDEQGPLPSFQEGVLDWRPW